MYHLPVALPLSATTNYKMVQNITVHMQRKISAFVKNVSHPGPTFGDWQAQLSKKVIHDNKKGKKICPQFGYFNRLYSRKYQTGKLFGRNGIRIQETKINVDYISLCHDMMKQTKDVYVTQKQINCFAIY